MNLKNYKKLGKEYIKMKETDNIQELLEQAWSQRRIGNYNEAQELVKQAQALCSDDNYIWLGRVYHIYAQFEADHDRYLKALKLYQQSLNFYEKSKDLNKIAHSTRHVADIQCILNLDSASEANYKKAIDIYKKYPKTKAGDLANALGGYGNLLEKTGKIRQAITTLNEVRKLYAEIGLKVGVEEMEKKLASLYSNQ